MHTSRAAHAAAEVIAHAAAAAATDAIDEPHGRRSARRSQGGVVAGRAGDGWLVRTARPQSRSRWRHVGRHVSCREGKSHVIRSDETQLTRLAGDETQLTRLAGDEIQLTRLAGDEAQLTRLAGDGSRAVRRAIWPRSGRIECGGRAGVGAAAAGRQTRARFAFRRVSPHP